jgi:hypothetical protein
MRDFNELMACIGRDCGAAAARPRKARAGSKPAGAATG